MIDKGYDKGVAFLSDHPTLASRVQAAKERASKLGPDARQWERPPVASPSKFRELQDRAARLAKTMPDDKSLAQAQKLLAALPRSCLTPAVQEDQVRAQKSLLRDLEEQERGTAPADDSSSRRRHRSSEAQ
jgi:hypothetical protein